MSAKKQSKNITAVVAATFGTVAVLAFIAFAAVTSNHQARYLDHTRAENAVVVLEITTAGSGAGATGTIIGHNLILTAKHVTKAAEDRSATLVATDYRGNHFDTTVVWESPEQDLAVLYGLLPEGSIAEPISCDLPRVGDNFLMLGHPQLNPKWVFAWGRFTSDLRYDGVAMGLGKLLVGESAGTHGDSGAPIFNDRNEIMGVLTGGLGGTGIVLITPIGDSCEIVKRVTA